MSADTIARPRRRLPNVTWYLLSMCLFSVYLALNQAPSKISEIFFSLKNGEMILQNRPIDAPDYLTWSRFGEVWFQTSIAHDVFLAVCDRYASVLPFSESILAGFKPGVLFVQAFVVLLSIIYFSQYLRDSRFCDPARIVGTLIFAALTYPTWTNASALWSLLFSVILFRLLRFPKRWDALKIILLALVWPLFNRDFFAFYALLLAVLLGAALDRDPKRVRVCGLALIGAVFVLLAHPLGRVELLQLVTAPLTFFCVHGVIGKEMLQWSTPDFHRYPIFAIGVGAIFAASFFKRSVFNWKFVFSLLASLLLMFLSLRFSAPFGIIGAFVIARVVHENLVGPSYAMIRFMKRFQAFRNSKKLHLAHLVLIGLSFLALRQAEVNIHSDIETLTPAIDAWKADLQTRNENLQLLNDYLFSGQIEHAGYPVFVDGRFEFMSQKTPKALLDSVLNDYSALELLTDDWKKVLEHWNFNGAILYEDRPLAQLLIQHEHWQVQAKTPPRYKMVKGRKVNYAIAFLTPRSDEPVVVPVVFESPPPPPPAEPGPVVLPTANP